MSEEEFKLAHWRRKVDILQLSRLFGVDCSDFCCDGDFIRSDSCGQTAQHLLQGASTGVGDITLLVTLTAEPRAPLGSGPGPPLSPTSSGFFTLISFENPSWDHVVCSMLARSGNQL